MSCERGGAAGPGILISARAALDGSLGLETEGPSVLELPGS